MTDVKMPTKEAVRRTWEAMIKFTNDEQLTEQEWEALSWMTPIDPDTFDTFGPDQVRWATDAERADNLAFYRSLHEDPIWVCQCDCGNVVHVRESDLLSGHTQSCPRCAYTDMTKGVLQ
jgi:hypothetical protein